MWWGRSSCGERGLVQRPKITKSDFPFQKSQRCGKDSRSLTNPSHLGTNELGTHFLLAYLSLAHHLWLSLHFSQPPHMCSHFSFCLRVCPGSPSLEPLHRAPGIVPLPVSGLPHILAFPSGPPGALYLKLIPPPSPYCPFPWLIFFFHITYHCT